MGQVQIGHGYFQEVRSKEGYESIPTLWSEADITSLIEKLRETTLNFSVDRSKFPKLLQLSTACDGLVAKWAEDFSRNRGASTVDGLEFLSAAIAVSSSIRLFQKISLLHSLFDLDRTGALRKDEFTIFLKSITLGLDRMLSGLPPPVSAQALEPMSVEYCNTLPTKMLTLQDFFTWVTEAPQSLPYLSILSCLGTTVFAMGSNRRRQLGLHFQKSVQCIPSPILSLEGICISSIASSESHCLFLTREGQVWSCGSGFCGILGHGSLSDRCEPQLIRSLSHARVVDVAVGVRHSVAVSEKGQVFTWGAAELGQLGHGSTEDRDVHEWAYDPKTGGEFAYVSKPTVVMALFGKKVVIRKVSCCNFSTIALTQQNTVYTWGNNTDGQCGQGQKCPDHSLVYLDANVHRTAMQAIFAPRLLQAGNCKFTSICAGGYHVLAIDLEQRLWTWGQGLWGKLGHGDQNSVYEPRVLDALQHHVCDAIAAGDSHSLCLCALFRLTVTGRSLKPFALLASPVGRVDRYLTSRSLMTLPNSDLQANSFCTARLLQVGLPFVFHPTEPIFDSQKQSPTEVQNSIVLVSRSLWEGEWLKLSVTDYDFSIKVSSAVVKLSPTKPLRGNIVFSPSGHAIPGCSNSICVCELENTLAKTPQELPRVISEIASQCQRASASACVCILPESIAEFDVSIPVGTCSVPVGVMNHAHGQELKKHVGKTGVQAALVSIVEDNFLKWLQRILDARPKGVIISQTSWRPDVELLDLLVGAFNLEALDIPIALVTYEAGEELRTALRDGNDICLAMEIQESGGLYAWGNSSLGQLGLGGIENRDFLAYARNASTGEENSFVDKPVYVADLHEHEVARITCGAAHTVAVTSRGEVFAWGAIDSLGFRPKNSERFCDKPLCVEQLSKHVKSKAAFAGGYHSFVVADMPYKSVASEIL